MTFVAPGVWGRCQASSLRALSAAWQIDSAAFTALVLLSSGSFLHMSVLLTFPGLSWWVKLLHLSEGISESMDLSTLSKK